MRRLAEDNFPKKINWRIIIEQTIMTPLRKVYNVFF